MAEEAVNANEKAFQEIRWFLEEHSAPHEIHEYLDGLQNRYELGKQVSEIRLVAHRELQKRLREAGMSVDVD